MKTIGDLRADAQHLRDVKKGITHPGVLAKLRELIAEVEARARKAENGA